MTDRMTYVTHVGLRERGWTDAMVRELLGDPDVQGRNPRQWSVAPVRLYLLARVEAVERAPEFAVCAAAAGRGSAATRVAADRRRRAVLTAIRAQPIEVPILPAAELEKRAVRHRQFLAAGRPAPGPSDRPPGRPATPRPAPGAPAPGAPEPGAGVEPGPGPGAGSPGARGARAAGPRAAGQAPGPGARWEGVPRAPTAGAPEPRPAGRPAAGSGLPGSGAPGEPGALVRWQVDYLRYALKRYDALLDGLFGTAGRAEAERLLRERVYGAIAQAYPRLAAECRRRIG
ncbi:hypothetical protein ACLGI4_04835 [Streptomyces sp. HMX112]|uniref:hypothetical protein n=1 Tax=Streptomyces sp. HMX112 TaxID=3390850 RepID=UPI003A7FFDD4